MSECEQRHTCLVYSKSFFTIYVNYLQRVLLDQFMDMAYVCSKLLTYCVLRPPQASYCNVSGKLVPIYTSLPGVAVE